MTFRTSGKGPYESNAGLVNSAACPANWCLEKYARLHSEDGFIKGASHIPIKGCFAIVACLSNRDEAPTVPTRAKSPCVYARKS